jgi:hypothetical protein
MKRPRVNNGIGHFFTSDRRADVSFAASVASAMEAEEGSVFTDVSVQWPAGAGDQDRPLDCIGLGVHLEALRARPTRLGQPHSGASLPFVSLLSSVPLHPAPARGLYEVFDQVHLNTPCDPK